MTSFNGSTFEEVWDNPDFVSYRSQWNMTTDSNGQVIINCNGLIFNLWKRDYGQTSSRVYKDDTINSNNTYLFYCN